MDLLKDEDLYERIKILNLQTLDIKNINDFYNAFENEMENKRLGKSVLRFKF